MKKTVSRLPFIYALICTLILTLAGSIGLLTPDFSSVYPLLFLVFFVLGVLHVFLFYRLLPGLTGSFLKEAGYTFILTILSAILIIAVYHYVSQDMTKGIGAATPLIAFLFPVIVAQVYHAFISIPPKDFKKWYYPVGKQLPDMDLLDLSRVLVIQFEFTKQASENAFTNFRAKAPTSMLFGELFFIFINDYNDRNAENPVQYH